ncbi:MAG: aldose epimerase family protein [Gammaproteobacteria bacterium]
MTTRPFGRLPDGRAVEAVTLGASGGLQAEVLTYGGILRRLILPARQGTLDLVLTLPDLDAYVRDEDFLGVLVGRVANRIAGAQFELNGRPYAVSANESPNHLHGGRLGFGKRLWRVLDIQTAPHHRLWLALSSPAGEEGYPGDLDVTAEFIVEADELQLRLEARCDVPTPVNLTYHPYFNLSGDPRRSTGEQVMRIPASGFLPVRDGQLIPTGEIEGVLNTPFDFRTPRPMQLTELTAHPQLVRGSGFDHCWVLDVRRDCDAELHSPHSGVTMTLHTDRPALQCYGGQHLSKHYPGLNGICLEPQGFPNAVNEPGFPSTIVEPGDPWQALFRYRFGLTGG